MLICVITALLAGGVNLIRRQWLMNIIALAIQYLAMFFLFTTVRPVGLAVIKLIVGWMVTLTLYITLVSVGDIYQLKGPTRLSIGEIFRALAGLFIVMMILLFLPDLKSNLFPQTSSFVLMASFGLMVIGLLQVSMISEPFYIIIGLLTFLSGFELLYASLELSTLLEALFVGVNLGLALVGAYFLVKDAELEKP
ncbi:MAG: hypothetical protein WA110_10370 [Anaerolineaceae bacterium]